MSTSGAAAGAISSLVFVVVHDIVISDIWDMAVVMLVAGAVCGALLAWVYEAMTEPASTLRWFVFTGSIVAALGAIPLLSVLVFDPIVPFEEVVSLDGPPGDLIGRAMPFTIVVTVTMSIAIAAGFGRLRRHLLQVGVAISVLMLLLGLNLTVVGLVEFTGSEASVVVGFVGLVALLGAVYAVVVPIVDRIRPRTPTDAPGSTWLD